MLLLPSFGGLPQWAVVGKLHISQLTNAAMNMTIFKLLLAKSILQVIHFLLVVLSMNQSFTARYYNSALEYLI